MNSLKIKLLSTAISLSCPICLTCSTALTADNETNLQGLELSHLRIYSHIGGLHLTP